MGIGMRNNPAGSAAAAARAPRALVAATALACTLALAACAGGQSVGAAKNTADAGSPFGFKTAAQDEKAEITVWVDSTRQPVAEAYVAAHPGTKVKIVAY